MSRLKIHRDIFNYIVKYLYNDVLSLFNLVEAFPEVQTFIKVNFEDLCIQNNVYRLPNETWLSAFVKLNERTNFETSSVLFFERYVNMVTCAGTHRVAFVYANGIVVVNLDLQTPSAKYFPTKETVNFAHLCRKGNRLIICTELSHSWQKIQVFNVNDGRELIAQRYNRSRSDYPRRKRLFFSIGGKFFDACSMRICPVDKGDLVIDCGSDLKENRYLYYYTATKLIVVDVREKKSFLILNDLHMNDSYPDVTILPSIGCVFIIYVRGHLKIYKIYDIYTHDLLMNYKLEDNGACSHRILCDYIIFNESNLTFWVYDDVRKKWNTTSHVVQSDWKVNNFEHYTKIGDGVKHIVIYNRRRFLLPSKKLTMLEAVKGVIATIKVSDGLADTDGGFIGELYSELKKSRDVFDFGKMSPDDVMLKTVLKCLRKQQVRAEREHRLED
ncbi:unnamed protein product [Bursaphelenchus okinawaensis]|uniref:Uncharacterized protein n=1 Tax=Bursaphelenchus okinawaensis TaxID=465554 RepID=A0A811KSJ5_9BILA|nr:unnamed protein product [Bursaphelenchus okinawaensis]CAG9111346.1 unnamed protein product [Bursaphelenchus okinawaensis]